MATKRLQWIHAVWIGTVILMLGLCGRRGGQMRRSNRRRRENRARPPQEQGPGMNRPGGGAEGSEDNAGGQSVEPGKFDPTEM